MFGRLFVVLSFYSAVSAFGQSVPQLMEIADQHYEAEQYAEAIEFYEKIVGLDKQNYQSKFRLAVSHQRTLHHEDAKEYFLQLATGTNEYQHESLFYYGSILKLESDFTGADSVFAHLITLPNVEENLLASCRKQKEGCQLALNYKALDRGFTIEEMEGLNSRFHDFGATTNRQEQTVVFVTTRNLKSNQYEGLQYDGLLPDLVQFSKRNNNWRNVSSRKRFDNLNTHWSEGSGSFTTDGKSFYFTSCRSNEGSNCKIMVSKLSNNRWGEPKPLNDYINLQGSESKHPNVSVSGDTLFFVSNRDGGYGGNDIWMSLSGIEEDTWTPAINLGNVINTAFNEITPYYSSAFDCILFSSDGHVGYGGYDIFAAKGVSFYEPEIYNLGDPFNSPLDDIYFTITDSAGYISSNRQDNTHLNLYSFAVSGERLYLSLLISGESLIDSRIVSRFKAVRSLDLTTFRLEDYQGFELFDPVKRQKPKPALLEDSPSDSTSVGATDLIASTNDQQDGDGLGSGSSLGNSLKGMSVSSGLNYLEGQITATDIVTEAMLASFQRSDFEKVYFEFGSTKLTKQAKLSLDNLINQVKLIINEVEYIQIVASTDDVGSNQYNLELSAKRANEARNYLVTKGYPVNKILTNARGESDLTTNGTTWYERFFDRKAEIFVYSNQPLTFRKSKKLLVRVDMRVENAAEILNISRNKIKIWNEMDTDYISKGDVIRIDEPVFTSSVKYFLDETDIKHKFFPYIVREGETISSVARKFRTPEELLVEINMLDEEVSVGDVVFVYNVNRSVSAVN